MKYIWKRWIQTQTSLLTLGVREWWKYWKWWMDLLITYCCLKWTTFLRRLTIEKINKYIQQLWRCWLNVGNPIAKRHKQVPNMQNHLQLTFIITMGMKNFPIVWEKPCGLSNFWTNIQVSSKSMVITIIKSHCNRFSVSLRYSTVRSLKIKKPNKAYLSLLLYLKNLKYILTLLVINRFHPLYMK